MSLDSLNYLFFLPVAFALYWAIPKRMNALRNCLLTVMSYVFYAYADCRFCGLLAVVFLATYIAGRVMHGWRGSEYAERYRITAQRCSVNFMKQNT